MAGECHKRENPLTGRRTLKLLSLLMSTVTELAATCILSHMAERYAPCVES